MAASSLVAGFHAAPRLLAPLPRTRVIRACSCAPSCTARAALHARRRAPATGPAVASSSFAQRVVHRGARLALHPRARSLKQPHARTGLLVQASFLGVGAPEAFVIAIVALLVFGPKGLAEIAKNLGQTLRAFQPTIKELQQVSQDFKSALDQEIGLDEPKSTSTFTGPRPDLDSKLTEEMRRASEAAAWGGAPPAAPLAGSNPSAQGATEVAASEPPAQSPVQPGKLPDLSKLDD